MLPAGTDREKGAAVAEFVMISGLLALIFAAVLQLGVAIHVRNTVIDSAMAGARAAAMVDSDSREAVTTTRELITAAVGSHYAEDISVEEATRNGIDVVVVRVRTPVPIIGLLGPARMWELEAHALRESIDGAR